MPQNPAPTGELDAEELLFLALQAMQQDRDEDAISLLKRGLVLEPESGVLHHLLGAMYAQLGMFERAIDEMTRAIACQPELQMARFQLGLLHFTSANLEAAEEVWQPLSELPEDDPLALFRAGLLHLGRDEFAAAIASLRRGLELNAEHPSLNQDMEMLAQKAAELMASGSGAAAPEPEPEPEPIAGDSGGHVLLSGYRGMGGGKKPS